MIDGAAKARVWTPLNWISNLLLTLFITMLTLFITMCS